MVFTISGARATGYPCVVIMDHAITTFTTWIQSTHPFQEYSPCVRRS